MSEKSVVEQIKHYQRDIVRCPEKSERMIRCIERLNALPVTISHLQQTGVGKSVNELRKCGGEVGAAANALVCKWKDMVREEEEDEDSISEGDDESKHSISSPDHRGDSPRSITSKDKCDSKNEKAVMNTSKPRKHDFKDSDSISSKTKNHQKSPSRSFEKEKEIKHGHDSKSDSKYTNHNRSRHEKKENTASKDNLKNTSELKYNGNSKNEKYEKKGHSYISKINSHNDKSHNKHHSTKSNHDKETAKREDHQQKKSVSKREIKQEATDSSEDDTNKPRSRKRTNSSSDEDSKCNQRYKSKVKNKHVSPSPNRSIERSDVDSDSDEPTNHSNKKRKTRPRSSSESDGNSSAANSYMGNDSNKGSDLENESSIVESEEIDNNKSENESSDESNHSEIYKSKKIKIEKESSPNKSNVKSKISDKSRHSTNKNNHQSSSSKSRHLSQDKSSYKEDKSGLVRIKTEKLDDSDSNDIKKHHKSSSQSQNKYSEKKVKVKIERKEDGSIDCESGASFGDALLGLGDSNKKALKRKPEITEKEKTHRTSKGDSSSERPKSKVHHQSSSSNSSSPSTSKSYKELDLLKKNIKLEPLDVDLKSTLPEISPHYKPLPHYSPPTSPLSKRSKQLTQEEALSTIMATKNQRTKVYSGNKSGYTKVPSLFELCTQVLRDNIDALEYTGGVPYDLLKPVLDRATADQLYQLEHYNPYLVEDTDNLWQFHCNKDFRGKKPDEFETWRELYLRCLDEREKKLEALKTNIVQSMAKSTPVRKTKLAYIDSVVKPPRNVAKKQTKFGTGKNEKHELVSKAMVGAASSTPAPSVVSVPAPPHPRSSNAFPIPNFLKKKKAPLMAKTLQLMKGNNRFKR